MTNAIQHLKLTCVCTPPWFHFVLLFLPAIALIINLYILIHGLIRKRRNGDAEPFARGALMASLCFLALGLIALLMAMARILHQYSDPTHALGQAQMAMWAAMIAQYLELFAWLLLPVTLGFVSACALKTKSRKISAGGFSSEDGRKSQR